MSLKRPTRPSTGPSWDPAARLWEALDVCEAVVVGAGAGLSVSAGLTYSGPRFEALFGDFRARYGFTDMYSGSFYPFSTLEEYWAFMSRYILCNRYQDPPGPVYADLLRLLDGRDYFILTTNVDHCFQRAGFDKERLFYTQGDFGLFQCSAPCRQETWDNEAAVRAMAAAQEDLRVPPALLPRCPRCGRPAAMNLRTDRTFVEDAGWHRAAGRYADFLRRHDGGRVLFLELGVGYNTPGIIKYPFWRMTAQNPKALYVCLNQGQTRCPAELGDRAVSIGGDIGALLAAPARNA